MRTVFEDQTQNQINGSQQVDSATKSYKSTSVMSNLKAKDNKENSYSKNLLNVLQKSKNVYKQGCFTQVKKTNSSIPLKAKLKIVNLYGFGSGRNRYKRKEADKVMKVEKLQFCSDQKCQEHGKGLKIKYHLLSTNNQDQRMVRLVGYLRKVAINRT